MFKEKEVKERVIKEMVSSCKHHIKKYGLKGMDIKEFEKFCVSL